MSNRGFSLLELLIAGVLLVLIASVIGLLASPLHHRADRGFADGDLVTRARTAITALADDLQQAGNGVAVGNASRTLHELLPVIVPRRTLDDGTVQPPFTSVSITKVLPAAQGVLRDPLAEGVRTFAFAPMPCARQIAGCGLAGIDVAVIFDAAHAESVAIQSVDPSTAIITIATPLATAFDRGAAVVGIERVLYGIRTASDGSSRLVRISTGGAEQPIVDHVVDFELSFVDAPGPSATEVRRVDIRLRLEAVSSDLRGPAGRLFRRAGIAPASRWVPDLELRTSVATHSR